MAKTFEPFVMERMMSLYEQDVDYNLSESGVHPIKLHELLADDPGQFEELLDTDLNYPHVNGIPALRENIARMYNGAGPDNVLVTVGAIEANYITTQTLVGPGDDMLVMVPNYMQIWGVGKNLGYNVNTFGLQEAAGWTPNIAELEAKLTPQTKLIAVCSPNNPTGRAMTAAEMDAIVGVAEKVGAYILADEVYSGAERATDQQSPSFYGRYDKVMAIGSMSKAYGLPGLRIGWVVGPQATLDEVWARHEYTTISATMLSNKLAALALSPEVRPRLLQRTRQFIREGYPVLEKWMAEHGDLFSLTPPDAAAIAFVRYHMDVNSTVLADRLRTEKSVLVVPGDHFGLDHYLRISYGLPHEYLVPGLERIKELFAELS
ncbi:aminotransferase class I/II-fold pyridoxal phosphate-dependent enzyme [Chloroflexota bacterium]